MPSNIDFTAFTGITVRLAGSMLSIEIPYRDLENAALQLARDAARSHGVGISAAAIRLSSLGPQAVAFDLEVTAEKLFLNVKIHITGEAFVDDQLVFRTRNLQCHGDGALGGLAATFIQPELQKHAGRAFRLPAVPGAPVKITAVELAPGPPLRIEARFTNQRDTAQ